MKKILLCAFAFTFAISLFTTVSVNAEEIRLGVMTFTSKVPNVSNAMTAPISDYFFKTLLKAGGIRLVERERLEMLGEEMRTGMYGLIDSGTAAKVGKLAGCNYMLLGALTNLQRAKKGSSFGKLFSQNKEKVRAVLDVRIVKVDTGDIIFAEDAAAEVEKEDKSFSFIVEQKESGFDGLEASAISQAVNKITPSIMQALRGNDNYSDYSTSSFVQSSPSPAPVNAQRSRPAPVQTQNPAPAANTEIREAPARTPAPAPAPAIGNISLSRKKSNFENRSKDPAKVIKSYGLSDSDTNRLIERHKDALKLRSKENRAETYAAMFEEYPVDFLAAYYAGLAEFDMDHGSRAVGWCEKSLSVNPRYYPAKELKKRAEGLLK